MITSLNNQWADFNWKIVFTIILLHYWHTIFLFSAVKLHWHNLYCIKNYINKNDLSMTEITQNDIQTHITYVEHCVFWHLSIESVP